MKKILAAMFLVSMCQGVRADTVELTELMTPEYYDDTYTPLRLEAERLDNVKDFVGAAKAYRAAAMSHSMSAIRAAHLRNSAYMLLKHAQTGIGPVNGLPFLEQAQRTYNQASNVLAVADIVGGRETSRALTKKHIAMGVAQIRHLRQNPKLMVTARKDL